MEWIFNKYGDHIDCGPKTLNFESDREHVIIVIFSNVGSVHVCSCTGTTVYTILACFIYMYETDASR